MLFAVITVLGIEKATELNVNVIDFLLAIPVVILLMVLPIIMQMHVGPKLWKGLID